MKFNKNRCKCFKTEILKIFISRKNNMHDLSSIDLGTTRKGVWLYGKSEKLNTTHGTHGYVLSQLLTLVGYMKLKKVNGYILTYSDHSIFQTIFKGGKVDKKLNIYFKKTEAKFYISFSLKKKMVFRYWLDPCQKNVLSGCICGKFEKTLIKWCHYNYTQFFLIE